MQAAVVGAWQPRRMVPQDRAHRRKGLQDAFLGRDFIILHFFFLLLRY